MSASASPATSAAGKGGEGDIYTLGRVALSRGNDVSFFFFLLQELSDSGSFYGVAAGVILLLQKVSEKKLLFWIVNHEPPVSTGRGRKPTPVKSQKMGETTAWYLGLKLRMAFLRRFQP